jgi:uncharacterized RDD family membrane protein YckC
VAGKLADRGARLGAAILDTVIVTIVLVPGFMGIVPTYLAAMRSSGEPVFHASMLQLDGSMIFTLLGLIAWTAITARLVWANGQTIAKRMVGIKVVRKDGSRASFARIFWLRNVVNSIPNFIPLVGYVYGLVDALLIFGATRQCLHDRIADTIVVRAP